MEKWAYVRFICDHIKSNYVNSDSTKSNFRERSIEQIIILYIDGHTLIDRTADDKRPATLQSCVSINVNNSRRRRRSVVETDNFLQEKSQSCQAETDAQNQESAGQIIQSNGTLSG